jgi:hypothetical protein
MKTQTGCQIDTPIWNTTNRGARIDSRSIALNLLNEGNKTWSLVITMNGTATHTSFDAKSLEEAKIAALSKLREIVDKLNRDLALLSQTQT